jgi:hypothetical protein
MLDSFQSIYRAKICASRFTFDPLQVELSLQYFTHFFLLGFASYWLFVSAQLLLQRFAAPVRVLSILSIGAARLLIIALCSNFFSDDIHIQGFRLRYDILQLFFLEVARLLEQEDSITIQHERWNVPNSEFGYEFDFRFRVQFAKCMFAVLGSHSFEDRRKRFARLAPVRPAIHQDDAIVFHGGLEIVCMQSDDGQNTSPFSNP